MTTVDTVFARTSKAKRDFQLDKAMNRRCRSPEQDKSRGTTNSHTGNSASTSLCTTSSPSCLVVPCVVGYPSHPPPARLPRREAWLGGGIPHERPCWGGGGGACHGGWREGGACDAATRHHWCISLLLHAFVIQGKRTN